MPCPPNPRVKCQWQDQHELVNDKHQSFTYIYQIQSATINQIVYPNNSIFGSGQFPVITMVMYLMKTDDAERGIPILP